MRHIDLDLALQVLQGELPPGALLRSLLDHLEDLCPECRQTLQILHPGEDENAAAWLDPPDPPLPPAGRQTELDLRYAAAFGRAGRDAVYLAEGIRRERRRARRDLKDLLALPAGEREARIVGARTRFRSRALAELLVETGRELVREDPAEARSLAELVPTVLLWTPGALEHPWSHVLRLRALAHRANAQRVAGDLVAAGETFRQVRALANARPPADPEVELELGSLEASLRIDQGRFVEAVDLLDRSIQMQQGMGDGRGLSRSLVQKGICLAESGAHAAATAAMRKAIALLSPETDEPLYVGAVLNLALCLCEADDHAAAREVVESHRSLFGRQTDAWSTLKREWIEGRIALGLGELETAERLLGAVRHAYLERNSGLDAAMVSLDLATLLLRQGRTSELKEISRLIQPVFESRDVPRETIAALLLFQKAVGAESLTADAIRKLRTYLQATGSRRRPDELVS